VWLFLTNCVERPNRCHIADVERVLSDHKKFNELVLFYKTKNLHEKALLLLKSLGSSDSFTDLKGVEPTITYLSDLKDQPDLLMTYSKWILASQPLRALVVFTQPNCPLDPYDILKHLESLDKISLSLRIAYLEYIKNKSTDPELHNRLILLYLQYITSQHIGLFEQAHVSDRLRKFLAESTHYNPEKMLSKFPMESMYEERAILLSKINRHSQALNIYVHKLHRPDLAEKYCEQHFSDDPSASEESREIFITLLKMYLQPPKGEEVDPTNAIKYVYFNH
jgi:hypothetical protein